MLKVPLECPPSLPQLWQMFHVKVAQAIASLQQDAIVFAVTGSPITTGIKGYQQVPFSGSITGWTILSADATPTSGSIVLDVWRDTYANYPPTVADTITASAKPTLTTAISATSTILTGWSKNFSAGDVFGVKVDSTASVTSILLYLQVQRS